MVEEKQYKISEMTKKIRVEAHVLRYWEEELQLPIKRNNLGHRYYTEEDVERFLQIKEWKEKGIQLKGIRSMLELQPDDTKTMAEADPFFSKNPAQSVVMHLPPADYTSHAVSVEREKEEKAYRLQILLKELVKEAVTESNEQMAEDIKESLIKEIDYQFRIASEEQEQQQLKYQKQQEEYFVRLDHMIQENLQTRKKKSTGLLRLRGKE